MSEGAAEIFQAFLNWTIACRGMSRALGAELKAHALTPAKVEGMVALCFDGPLSLTELARRRQTTRGEATQLADRLCKDGLAERVPNPTHRRRYLLQATTKGRSVLRRAGPRIGERLALALSPLGADERRRLGTIARRLADLFAPRDVSEE